MKVDAIKDGRGNIVITEDSFEMLLACLDNQKFIGEFPKNGDSVSVGENQYYKTQQDMQDIIDFYSRECRNILHQKYILRTEYDGYFLAKRYEHQLKDSEWTGDDVNLVYKLFKDTRIVYKESRNLLPLDGSEMIMEGTKPIGKTEDGWLEVEPEPRPWLIERPLSYDYEFLSISEDGKTNRPWTQDEVNKIQELLNNEGVEKEINITDKPSIQ